MPISANNENLCHQRSSLKHFNLKNDIRHSKVHGLLFEKKKKRLACTTWNECKLGSDGRGAGELRTAHLARPNLSRQTEEKET